MPQELYDTMRAKLRTAETLVVHVKLTHVLSQPNFEEVDDLKARKPNFIRGDSYLNGHLRATIVCDGKTTYVASGNHVEVVPINAWKLMSSDVGLCGFFSAYAPKLKVVSTAARPAVFNGHAAYKVELEEVSDLPKQYMPKDQLRHYKLYIDRETGLPLGSELSYYQLSDRGEKQGPIGQTMLYEGLQLDGPLDSSVFTKPAGAAIGKG